jgi:hypothetical protein
MSASIGRRIPPAFRRLRTRAGNTRRFARTYTAASGSGSLASTASAAAAAAARSPPMTRISGRRAPVSAFPSLAAPSSAGVGSPGLAARMPARTAWAPSRQSTSSQSTFSPGLPGSAMAMFSVSWWRRPNSRAARSPRRDPGLPPRDGVGARGGRRPPRLCRIRRTGNVRPGSASRLCDRSPEGRSKARTSNPRRAWTVTGLHLPECRGGARGASSRTSGVGFSRLAASIACP